MVVGKGTWKERPSGSHQQRDRPLEKERQEKTGENTVDLIQDKEYEDRD